MKQFCLAAVMIWASSGGQAACASNLETFLSCDVGRSGKMLNVCFNDTIITYSFGRPGAPDLGLAETIADVDYAPWPGVGRTIWEEVRFESGDYSYVTHTGFERLADNDIEKDHENEAFGGVVVMRNGDTIAELNCISGTVDAPWGDGLSQAKQAAGLTWDYSARQWRRAQ